MRTRTAPRAALRRAVIVGIGLAGLVLPAVRAGAATPPEKVLPNSTYLFVKITNAARAREAFRQGQYGQLWGDPALTAWKEELTTRFNDQAKNLKAEVGLTLSDLLGMLEGPMAMAQVARDDPDAAPVLVLTLDVGKNAAKLSAVMGKATRSNEENGSKVQTLEFQGVTVQVVHPPAKSAKDKEPASPPLVWSKQGDVFTITTDLDMAKDLIAHAEGRDDSLAATEPFLQAQKKFAPNPHVIWYIEAGRFFKRAARSGLAPRDANGNATDVKENEAMLEVLGAKGVKAVAGSVVLSTGNYDSLTKTVVVAPTPFQGLLKVFQLPKVEVKPESWVPASVSSYRTINWDLDKAYVALNNLLDQFQPGMLSVLEQQLVGPNGGEPLSFQKDLFGPLGNRVTIISDFKKPIKEENQRTLIGVPLDTPKALQNALPTLLSLLGEPKKREFLKTTIYEVELPELPDANPGTGPARGPMSVAIAKNTLFLSDDPTLLEQVLRGGGPSLADNPNFQAVAREITGPVSGMSYARPEEQARIQYDMLKSGQFERQLQGAGAANPDGGGGFDLSRFAKVIDKDKLPEFSIFAKYLAAGGGYSTLDEDGIVITGFTLRKTKP